MAKKRKKRHAKKSHAKKRANPRRRRRKHAAAAGAAPVHHRRRRHNPKRRHHARRRRNPASSGGKASMMSLLTGAAVGLGSAVAVRVIASKIAPGSGNAQKGLAAAVGVASLLFLKKRPVMASSVLASMASVVAMNDLALRAEIAMSGHSPVARAHAAANGIAAIGSGQGYMDLNGLEVTSGQIQALVQAGGDMQGVIADSMGAVASDSMGDAQDVIDDMVSGMGDPFFGGDSITG